jgi:hypothetical protein
MPLSLAQKKHWEKKSFSGCHKYRKGYFTLRKGTDLLIPSPHFFMAVLDLQMDIVL